MEIPDGQPGRLTIGEVPDRLFASPLGDELCALVERAPKYLVGIVFQPTQGRIDSDAIREHPEIGELAMRIAAAEKQAVLCVRRLW